ncbi:MAG TPA: EAL domain-containing protein [Stenomitos sp.]
MRFALVLRWQRSSCPKCSYSLKRIKVLSAERSIAKFLRLPIKRYQCERYQCRWEGVSLYNFQNNDIRSHLMQNQVTLSPSGFNQSLPHNVPSLRAVGSPLGASASSKLGDTQFLSLQSALESGEFLLHYQPIINLKTKNITGMEALLRWQHPERGLLYPSDFFSIFEEGDFIYPLERWLFSRVCAQIRKCHQAGIYPLNISVNLSAREFYHPELSEIIARALSRNRIDPQYLEVEVSENTIFAKFDAAVRIVKELHSVGVQVVMDNCGTYSQQGSNISRLALNTLKIDQSLVHDLQNPNVVATIQSLIELANACQFKVVAKGVETREQLAVLEHLGCKEVQGYLFDTPLPVDEVTDVLEANWLGRKPSAAS